MDEYIHYYNNDRIQRKLDYISLFRFSSP
ncbi:IS3 family transposase [Bacillus cereus]